MLFSFFFLSLIFLLLALRQECEKYNLTSQAEQDDDENEEEEKRRKRIKKVVPDFLSDGMFSLL